MAKRKGLDLKKFPDQEEEERNRTRAVAKVSTKTKMENHLKNRLGVVIDGTGRHYSNIKKQKDHFELYGYAAYMIFVNTSLEVALERNAKRNRSLKEDFVKDAWNAVQNNMGKFQSLFGSNNFKIIDNNEYASDDSIFNTAWKEVMKFSKKPVSSHIAKQWIENELEKRKR
jgi:predicted kinase